jgi:hypothetical protein
MCITRTDAWLHACIYARMLVKVHTYIHASALAHLCAYKHVGLARTIYIRCLNGIFGREIINYTVMYGVYIQFWPPLQTCIQINVLTCAP